MTIYIIRHGETEYNRLGIVQGSGIDSDLNDTGIRQARAFFNAYQHLEFDLIVTSKLKRTHQTVAEFIQRGTPWTQRSDINEISWGDHEGLSPKPEHIVMFQTMLEEWKKGNLEARLPGGETAKQLSERLSGFIDWLKSRNEKQILIATHGRTMRCLVAMLKGMGPADMEGIPHLNTGCYLAHYRNGQFVFELENDVSHLELALA